MTQPFCTSIRAEGINLGDTIYMPLFQVELGPITAMERCTETRSVVCRDERGDIARWSFDDCLYKVVVPLNDVVTRIDRGCK